MLVFRPANHTDLPGLEIIASESDVGITSLPVNRDQLHKKIVDSTRSLQNEDPDFNEGSYLFVLEDTDKHEVVGVSAITASAGGNEPFYNYRREDVIHNSQQLGVHNRLPALNLCHDLTGMTLLGSFFIKDEYKETQAAELLSRARLMFIAEFNNRFSDKVIAEIIGFSDEEEVSPFWENVGRKFFDMDYSLAEYYCGVKSKSFIAEMVPPYPIYECLLSEEAQSVIGRSHPHAKKTLEYLYNEGFELTKYVDIFDAGPTVIAKTHELKTINSGKKMYFKVEPPSIGGTMHMISNTQLSDFRCCLGQFAGTFGENLVITEEIASALQLKENQQIRVSEL